mmetsp:Transcript_44136/g.116785  ORF Transcript_44136/g.116785 Transcript_44136/m.116785 type:complete len:233 (-) Transcript_44136:961-1659(-)
MRTGPKTCVTGSHAPSLLSSASASAFAASEAAAASASSSSSSFADFLRQRIRPSTYLPNRATMKSGVLVPSTRNCCRAALRSFTVGNKERMRWTSAFSAPLQPKRCTKSSRLRTTNLEACSDSSPSTERCSEARRHSQRRLASGSGTGICLSEEPFTDPLLVVPGRRQQSTLDSVCFSSAGSLQATLNGSCAPSSSGGSMQRRKQACKNNRGHISMSSRTRDALYLASDTRG